MSIVIKQNNSIRSEHCDFSILTVTILFHKLEATITFLSTLNKCQGCDECCGTLLSISCIFQQCNCVCVSYKVLSNITSCFNALSVSI